MIRWRLGALPALAIIAAACFLAALLIRPTPLPQGTANYPAGTGGIPLDPNRAAAPGLTYAIDSLEVNGEQRPIDSVLPVRTSGPIIVHGWAVIPGTLAPGRNLYFTLDGSRPQPVVPYGTARPDVGTVVGQSAVNSGFAATIPTARLRPGAHIIRFIIEDTAGKRSAIPTPVSFTILRY